MVSHVPGALRQDVGVDVTWAAKKTRDFGFWVLSFGRKVSFFWVEFYLILAF